MGSTVSCTPRDRNPPWQSWTLPAPQGDAYQHLTDQLESRYGRLDGLLHNAGVLGDRSPIEHYDIGLWQRVMQVNLNAPFILTRCLLPLLRRADDASVVFTTSGVGNRGRSVLGRLLLLEICNRGIGSGAGG